MKETLSRTQVADGMVQIMSLLSGEMTKFVTDVYDAGFQAGKASSTEVFDYAVVALQANVANENISDTDFRKLVGSVVAQLPALGNSAGVCVGGITRA